MNIETFLMRVPKIWAHKHYTDESWENFNNEFVDCCEICAERLDFALENGERCRKHPLAYFEKGENGKKDYCEECDQSKLEVSK